MSRATVAYWEKFGFFLKINNWEYLPNPLCHKALSKGFSSPVNWQLSLEANVLAHAFNHGSGVQQDSSSCAGSGCNLPASFLWHSLQCADLNSQEKSRNLIRKCACFLAFLCSFIIFQLKVRYFLPQYLFFVFLTLYFLKINVGFFSVRDFCKFFFFIFFMAT